MGHPKVHLSLAYFYTGSGRSIVQSLGRYFAFLVIQSHVSCDSEKNFSVSSQNFVAGIEFPRFNQFFLV